MGACVFHEMEDESQSFVKRDTFASITVVQVASSQFCLSFQENTIPEVYQKTLWYVNKSLVVPLVQIITAVSMSGATFYMLNVWNTMCRYFTL